MTRARLSPSYSVSIRARQRSPERRVTIARAWIGRRYEILPPRSPSRARCTYGASGQLGGDCRSREAVAICACALRSSPHPILRASVPAQIEAAARFLMRAYFAYASSPSESNARRLRDAGRARGLKDRARRAAGEPAAPFRAVVGAIASTACPFARSRRANAMRDVWITNLDRPALRGRHARRDGPLESSAKDLACRGAGPPNTRRPANLHARRTGGQRGCVEPRPASAVHQPEPGESERHACIRPAHATKMAGPRATRQRDRKVALPAHGNEVAVGRAGLEPATDGLKERSHSQHLQAVSGPRGRVVGIAARALLDAAERGVVFRDDAEALAREWLEATGGNLALEVIEANDDHAAARVIELAQHVLRVLATDESAGEIAAHGGQS